MAKWAETPEGRHVALLTPEEDAAADDARASKKFVEEYFHVQLNFVTDKPGTWTAHLGQPLGDRLWEVLKGGSCAWCDNKRRQRKAEEK